MKRDDFENFDELIETAEDEEMAGVFSDKIKLLEDKELPSASKAGPDLHSHLHSFEEEESYYDSQDDNNEANIGSNDYE